MKRTVLLRLLVGGLIFILLLTASMPAANGREMARVWVEFAPGTQGSVQSALKGAGAQFHYEFSELSSFVVTMPSQALTSLSKNPNVVSIEEDARRYPISVTASTGLSAPAADVIGPNGQTIPWGIDAVQARDIWDVDRNGAIDDGVQAGSGKTLCIIDSGFYSGHEDLAEVNLVGGISQVDDNALRDGLGHGSHVAGTVAGSNNSLGVVGVAPNVSLYIVKIFGDDGLWTNSSDLVAAINTCASNGASVISMSLGGPTSSRKEERAFDSIYAQGILSIAAAGNAGTTDYEYPGSYNSVMSVAAIDEALAIADFSQQTDQVEISGPGVAVLSTVPYIDNSNFTIGGVTYDANHIEFSARESVTAAMVDGGLCDTVGSWTGQIVLCERGEISFYEKVINAQTGGGVGAIIFNNEPGNFLGTLGDGETSAIIGISISQEDGQYLFTNQLGSIGTINSEYLWPVNGYEHYDGTSMATPHVAAVASLIWSQVPDATAVEIRSAINDTALDLGDAGKDNLFGYGLVQAADALAVLDSTPPAEDPIVVEISTDQASYVRGATATISVVATDDVGTAISGAAVTVAVTDPRSRTTTLSGTTDNSGTAVLVYTTKSFGTYTVTATVTQSGYDDGSDIVTFEVLK